MRQLCLVVFFVAAASPAFATPLNFGFKCITTDANAAGSCSIGEAQLSGTVTAGIGPNDVLFTFTNAGPQQSSVAEIYFDTTLSLLNPTVINGPGVNFCIDGQSCPTGNQQPYDVSPGNLPGGNTISFSADYSAGATNPAPINGINPGEQLSIGFTVANGSLDTVLTAMQQDTFRIGAHVVSFPNGNPSAAFVDQLTATPTPVPEPASLFLLGGGLCGLRALRRRR